MGVGHVARGEHAGHVRLEVLVDRDPVVDGDSRLRGELGAWLYSDADDHEAALELAAVARTGALDLVILP